MDKRDAKLVVFGAVGGMLVLLIVSFWAGLVVTTGEAKAMVQEASANAVMKCLLPIAISQFMNDPNRESRFAELQKLVSWGKDNSADFVVKHGWATMPGQTKPDVAFAASFARYLKDFKSLKDIK